MGSVHTWPVSHTLVSFSSVSAAIFEFWLLDGLLSQYHLIVEFFMLGALRVRFCIVVTNWVQRIPCLGRDGVTTACR